MTRDRDKAIIKVHPPSPAPLSMRPLSCLLLVACSPHALTVPGPLASLGREPVVQEVIAEELPARQAPESPRTDSPAQQDSLDATHPRSAETALGRAVADAAAHYLRHKPPGRNDCSGFVCDVYARAGVPLAGSTRSLWELARSNGAVHHRKVPAIGDLVFFDNTYDKDRDGKRNDDLTHVAVVMEVLGDGTVIMAHAGTSQGRAELRMNLQQPTEHEDAAGSILNDYLRARRSSDPEDAPRLAGELFRAFATVNPRQVEAWASTR